MTEHRAGNACSLSSKLDEDLMRLARTGKAMHPKEFKSHLSFSSISDDVTECCPPPSKTQRMSEERQTIVALHGDVSVLQHRLDVGAVSRKRSLILHDEEKNALQLRNQRLEEEVSSRKQKLQSCVSNISNIRMKLDMCEKELASVQNSADDKLFKLARANIDRERSLMEKVDSLTDELGRTKNELHHEKLNRGDAEEKLIINSRLLEAKSNEVDNYKQYIAQKDKELKNMSALQQQVQSLESTLQRNQESDALVNAMKSKLDKFPALESENTRLLEENQNLRDREANTFLLRDENLAMRRKVEALTQTQANLASAEVELERTRERLKRWEDFEKEEKEGSSPGTPGRSVFRSPEELHRHLRELQRDNLRLSENRGRLQSAVRQLETRKDLLEREIAAVKHRSRDDEERRQNFEAEMRRLRQRFNLVSQERDLTRRLLNDYEEEATSTIVRGDRDRINSLNALLENYRTQIAEQDRTIVTLRRLDAATSQRKSQEGVKVLDVPTQDSIVAQTSEKLMAELRERIAGLEETLAKVTEEKEILEARIEMRNMQGDYDPTKVKVLHLTANPAADSARRRAEELDRLRSECERLRERVKVLEEVGAAGAEDADVTGIVEQRLQDPSVPMAAQKEVEELKAKLNSEARKAERLIEVFKERSSQLREACFHLLGHRLDIKAGGEVKLTSAFAESHDEFLLFRVEESESEPGASVGPGNQRWMLMETEYSRTLQKDIEHYIKTFNSIPAMICSVFLESFGRQTMTE